MSEEDIMNEYLRGILDRLNEIERRIDNAERESYLEGYNNGMKAAADFVKYLKAEGE